MLEFRVQIYLLITVLHIKSLQFKIFFGEKYLHTLSEFENLKSNFKLRPKFIIFWNGFPPYYKLPYNLSSIKPCPYTNCFYADSLTVFDPTLFDAVVFVAEVKTPPGASPTPRKRLPHQKYIFFTMEPPQRDPMTLPIYDDLFNWTWTYKLDSTEQWPYFYIFDKKGNKIGPKKHMKWIKNMDSIDDTFAKKLSSKTKAAVWVVSNCETTGKRENYAHYLKKSLKSLGLILDVYGECGQRKRNCTSILHGKCSAKIKRHYYFYLSFENSIAEDYVTEKVYNALMNNAVPIVYGGVDYSRFLPRGSYLNARKYAPSQLALKMKRIIDNRTRYNDFFRWRNHYKYTLPGVAHTGCRFCSALNYDARMKRKMLTTFANFTSWWNK